MSNEPPFYGKPEPELTDSEWRVLVTYRLGEVERKVDRLFHTIAGIAVTLLAGVLLWLITSHSSSVSSSLQAIKDLIL